MRAIFLFVNFSWSTLHTSPDPDVLPDTRDVLKFFVRFDFDQCEFQAQFHFSFSDPYKQFDLQKPFHLRA